MDRMPQGKPRGAKRVHVHGIPDDYVAALPGVSTTMLGVLHEAGVTPEYANAYGHARNAFDIVLLWRRGVDPEYALQFGERRDLTVLDIADLWDTGIPAEYGTLV